MGKFTRMIAMLFNRDYEEPQSPKPEVVDITKGYTDEEVSTVALRLLDVNRYNIPVYFSDVETCDVALDRIAKERTRFEYHPDPRIGKALKSWFDYFERRAKEAKKQANKDQRIKDLEQKIKEHSK